MVSNLDDISDVAINNPQPNDILGWDGGAWVNAPFYLGNLGNVNLAGYQDGYVLSYDITSNEWIAKDLITLPDATGKAGWELSIKGLGEKDNEWSPIRTTPKVIDFDYTMPDGVNGSIVDPVIAIGFTLTIPERCSSGYIIINKRR